MNGYFGDAELLNADQEPYRLKHEQDHVHTEDCWYQDEICPDVWIHNDKPVGNA